MKETPQQYTERILGYVESKQPLVVQAGTAKKLDRLIKRGSTPKLRGRPAPDKWSVNEILAHLADSEIIIGFRLRLILGAGEFHCSGRSGLGGDEWSIPDFLPEMVGRQRSG